MVSSSNVSGDSQKLSSVLSNYTSRISELSSSWKGISCDNTVSKAEEFASTFTSTITSQMNSFAEAINLYNQYIEAKSIRQNAQNNYNTAVSNKDTANANTFSRQVNDQTTIMNSLKTQINSALSSAAGSKLQATPLSITEINVEIPTSSLSSASSNGQESTNAASTGASTQQTKTINVLSDNSSTSSSAASGEFINYYQYNYSEPYSQGTIETSGCGPTSLAMVLTNLTGREITPVETAKKGNGRYTCSKGTYWSYFGDMAEEYGVNCEQMSSTSSNIVNQLNNGKTLILSMGPGHFTKGGHFIVVRGIDDNGKLIVSDPASEQRSNQTWDVDLVASESKQLWAMSN